MKYKHLTNLGFVPEIVFTDLFMVDRVPYIETANGHRKESYPVYSEETKNLVNQAVYRESGIPPTKTKRDEILSILAAEAFTQNKTKDIWIRTAYTNDGIEIDLNNPTGQCVKILPQGWEIAETTATFYRPSSSRALVNPDGGGNWLIFKKHFRTKSDDDLKLIIGFMLAALRPEGPYPVLVLQGEQGSAKSTTAAMLKALIDPAMGSTRGLIRKEHDLFIAAKNNHLISFDNISLISNELSDSLCRLATTGSFSARTLYTNDGETLIELCKPILLNGITDFINRPDLASRSITVEMPIIPEDERRTLAEVMADFNDDLPKMLGVLMDGLSSAIAYQDKVKLDRLPRLADVVQWCTAAEKGLGWEAGAFLRALGNNQLDAVLNQLSTDAVATALRAFMATHSDRRWVGSASELLAQLIRFRPDSENSRGWPSSASYLSQYLSRLAPSLRTVGLHFAGKQRSSAQRSLMLEKLENFEEMNIDFLKAPASLNGHIFSDAGFGGEALSWIK